MRHRARWSCALGLIVSTLGHPAATRAQATNAQATANTTAQLTLAVPVEIQSFSPDVTQAQVFCQLGSTGNPSAKGFINVPFSNGAYRGTVNVPVTLSVATPGAKWDYRCNLTLFNSKLNQWNFDGAPTWATPATGTKPQLATTGSVVVGQTGSR